MQNSSEVIRSELDVTMFAELVSMFGENMAEILFRRALKSGVDIKKMSECSDVIMDVLHELLGAGADFMEMQAINSLKKRFDVTQESVTIKDIVIDVKHNYLTNST
ncbi:hypothetical protein [Nitrosopumilus sp. Nsub]|uniref:hypothetical protein n=1 Tax=Nitrosopumilus sp. Nsub TaxID=1776294 RepID=UPI00082A6420|nr:hypothetical protein [Nitrosopumilus sp. Nsub]